MRIIAILALVYVMLVVIIVPVAMSVAVFLRKMRDKYEYYNKKGG